jgi:hypothetical protein
MALISCLDCKKLISDSAEKCVHCGRPTLLAEINQLEEAYESADQFWLENSYREEDRATENMRWALNQMKEIRKSIEEKRALLK